MSHACRGHVFPGFTCPRQAWDMPPRLFQRGCRRVAWRIIILGHAMIDALANIAMESWAVLGEMAPYLLFGFLMAGVLSICISPEFIERHLGGRGFGPVCEGVAAGRAAAVVFVRSDSRGGLVPSPRGQPRRHHVVLAFDAANRRRQHRRHLRPAGIGVCRVSARSSRWPPVCSAGCW